MDETQCLFSESGSGAGVVNGEKVLIQLDTGCSRTCVDEKVITKFNLPANTWGYEIKDVRLGSFQFRIKMQSQLRELARISGSNNALPCSILFQKLSLLLIILIKGDY